MVLEGGEAAGWRSVGAGNLGQRPAMPQPGPTGRVEAQKQIRAPQRGAMVVGIAGIAVLHRHAVNHIHDLGEQHGGGDGEARVFHGKRVGGIVAAERAEEGEDVLIHDLEHFLGLEMFEARPAAIFVGAFLGIFAFREDAALHRFFEPGGFILLQRVQVIEPLEEQEVGDLLDDFERIGNAADEHGYLIVGIVNDLAHALSGPSGQPQCASLADEFAAKTSQRQCVFKFLVRPLCFSSVAGFSNLRLR